jgi:predicted enzyme related to lactoylglutathione lyase
MPEHPVSLEELLATVARMEARFMHHADPALSESWRLYCDLAKRFESDLAASERDVALAKSAALMLVQTLARRAGVLVNIDVPDLMRASAFYCVALGLSIGRRFGDSAVELLGAAAPLYLLAKPAGCPAAAPLAQQRSYERHWTPVHLDIVVPEIKVALERAVAAGATLEGEITTHKWGHIALMADPFGHGFCLIQFVGRGYDEIVNR